VAEDLPVLEYPVIGKKFLEKAGCGIFWFGHSYTVELSIGGIRLKNDRFVRVINPFISSGAFNFYLFFLKILVY